MARKPKKDKVNAKPKVNPDLDGFEIKINSFGEIQSSYDIEKINAFLNKNVDDKKLRDRDDLDDWKEEKPEEDDSLFFDDDQVDDEPYDKE
ncbi:MAG: hypothetical protein LAT68_09920 [Cyclobacteriaceae bacterium]|nr:hypothetical protein [Cyclobacteriaceae bacterium]MCH8516633.1 hypothetical protein [Cyclobacteriaceae bacterium]